MSTLAVLYRPLWQSRTYRESAFLLLGLVSGVLWFSVVISLYAVGFATAVVWIGVPLLFATHRAVRWIAVTERWQVRTFLGVELPDVPPFRVPSAKHNNHRRFSGFAVWAHTVLHDSYSWRGLAWLTFRVVSGPIGFALALAAWVSIVTLALLPLALVLPGMVPPVEFEGWMWAALGGPVAAAVVAPLLFWPMRGWAALHARLSTWALGLCEAERTRAATERAELAEQQVRIDQELHDSIGHMITMNIVQAGAGAHVFETDPDFARQALKNIEERGRVAMAELDRIIATLRGDEAQPRAPLPGLENIDDLVIASRAAGVNINATVTDQPVPAALGRAAYGIVRESITNAAKYARGSVVHVHVEIDEDALGVAVVNTAPTATAPALEGIDLPLPLRPGTRHGLAGIRDRAMLLGGRSETGPTPDGGFSVMVLLPLDLALSASVVHERTSCCSWNRLRDKVMA